MKGLLPFFSGHDRFWLVIRTLHLLYLAFMVLILYVYFFEIRPLEIHDTCAQSSADSVLKIEGADSYQIYQNLYKSCSQKLSQLPF